MSVIGVQRSLNRVSFCKVVVFGFFFLFAASTGQPCTSDAECEDGLFCTVDSCYLGSCVVLSACPASIPATIEVASMTYGVLRWKRAQAKPAMSAITPPPTTRTG